MVSTTSASRPDWRTWLSLALIVSATWALSEGAQWWQNRKQAERVAALLSQHRPTAGDVVMFTTSSCPFCSRARAWLKRHDVPFTECNVEQSASCQQAYEQQGSPGVPLMRVKGLWHLGFEPEWLLMALQKIANAGSQAQG